jgi:hypothetical protein
MPKQTSVKGVQQVLRLLRRTPRKAQQGIFRGLRSFEGWFRARFTKRREGGRSAESLGVVTGDMRRRTKGVVIKSASIGRPAGLFFRVGVPYAAVHEFGSRDGTTPARLNLRNDWRASFGKAVSFMRDGIKAAFRGGGAS